MIEVILDNPVIPALSVKNCMYTVSFRKNRSANQPAVRQSNSHIVLQRATGRRDASNNKR